MTGDGHLSGAAKDGTATRESARNIRVRAGPEIRRLPMCAARNACRCILQREGATLRGPRSSAAGGCRRRDPQRPPSSTSRTRGTRSTRGQAAARSAAPLTDETNEDVRAFPSKYASYLERNDSDDPSGRRYSRTNIPSAPSGSANIAINAPSGCVSGNTPKRIRSPELPFGGLEFRNLPFFSPRIPPSLPPLSVYVGNS